MEIVDFVIKLGVTEIITIGGYATNRLEGNVHVLGASNSKKHKELMMKAGVLYGEAKGSIVGMAGMIPALARFASVLFAGCR